MKPSGLVGGSSVRVAPEPSTGKGLATSTSLVSNDSIV